LRPTLTSASSQKGYGPMIQLSRLGTSVSGADKDIAGLRGEFERVHCVKLPGLLEPGLFQFIQRQLANAKWYTRTHDWGGKTPPPVELCMEQNSVSALLHFLVSGDKFFRAIEQITGCGTIGHFEGRVYRMLPVADHFDQWHSDVGMGRLIALSINLSEQVYGGGALQIRDHDSLEIIHEVQNTGFGDGIIFRVTPRLQHRVSNVEGNVEKAAFAGWFTAQPGSQASVEYRLFGQGRL
jgi:hypothetical protein